MTPGAPSDPSRWSNDGGRKFQSDAWGAMGLLISGVLVWGGVGGLISLWLDNTLPLVIGLLVGMFAAMWLVWFRFGRS